MSLAVSAVLAGGGYPRAVQVSVTGLTVGVAFAVTAATPDGFTWTVRGGNGQPAATATVVLADISTPLNMAITYTAVQTGWASASATTVTVPYTGQYILQSLDGHVAIPFLWQDNGLPVEFAMRTVIFDVPGRPDPPVRWDVSAGDSSELRVRMTRAASEALRTRFRTAGPLLLVRTDGNIRDFSPVQYIAVTRASSVLFGADDGVRTDRVWSLAYTVISDPEPSVVLAASSWDDFDAAYSALTWADFDAEWSTLTWDDFDATDWATH
ncbi:MAG TPA: hypothetical protein VFE45_11305 [Coriobacteriia bacterium]|nr:hypothetical protein [Coriobacteriia bacterium]